MTGISGVLGDQTHRIDWMTDDLQWNGSEETAAYDDERVALRGAFHPTGGPSTASGDR